MTRRGFKKPRRVCWMFIQKKPLLAIVSRAHTLLGMAKKDWQLSNLVDCQFEQAGKLTA
jgi:hypothetical protein